MYFTNGILFHVVILLSSLVHSFSASRLIFSVHTIRHSQSQDEHSLCNISGHNCLSSRKNHIATFIAPQ